MSWIESHQALSRHPKVIRLKTALNITKAQAIGHLHLLWWWALDYAQDGNLSRFTASEIADAAEYPGSPDDFLRAMKNHSEHSSGWIDDNDQIHDWQTYGGNLFRKRAANASRMRAARAANVQDTCKARDTNTGSSPHVQRTCIARAGATGQDKTGHKRLSATDDQNPISESSGTPETHPTPVKTLEGGDVTLRHVMSRDTASASASGRESAEREPKTTWLTPYFEAWQAVMGGPLAASKSVRPLKALEKLHGPDKTLAALKNYLADHQARNRLEFASIANFAEHFGQWLPKSENTSGQPAWDWSKVPADFGKAQ